MGLETLLLPVTYFPMNIVYPFTLRVTGIINKIQKKENSYCFDIIIFGIAQEKSEYSNIFLIRITSRVDLAIGRRKRLRPHKVYMYEKEAFPTP